MSGDTSAEPVDPICLACGGLVGYYERYGPQWNIFHATEPVKLDPDSRVQWTSLYRAIFSPEPTGELPIRLSGIGRYDAYSQSVLKVTWDRDSENINTPQWLSLDPNRDYIWAINLINCFNSNMPAVGFIIHAHCWTLLERRFLGRRLAESNLLLLETIFEERFFENPYDIHQFQDPQYHTRKVSTPTKRWRPPEDDAIIEHALCYPSNDPRKICEFENERTRHVISLRDPLKIPEIPRLIRHSMQNKSREGMKRKTRKWSTLVSSSLQTRSWEYYQIVNLPLEMIFVILDNLSRSADIRNALMAFNWSCKIPDSYWKSRMPWDLIFELEEVSRPDDIDWKFLFLGIRHLQENSPDLQNRERVLGLLGEVSRRFLARYQSEN